MFPKSLFKREQSFSLLLCFFLHATDWINKLVHLYYDILGILDLPDCSPDVMFTSKLEVTSKSWIRFMSNIFGVVLLIATHHLKLHIWVSGF